MRKTVTISIIGIIVAIIAIIGVSYAFYTSSILGNVLTVDATMGFDECIDISVAGGPISLTGEKAIPIDDYKVLGVVGQGTSPDYKTSFTVNNHCPTAKTFEFALALDEDTINSENLIDSIKYAIYPSNVSDTSRSYLDARFLNTDNNYVDFGDNLIDAMQLNNRNVLHGFLLTVPNDPGIPANSYTNYDLYLWNTGAENGTDLSTLNSNFKGYIIVGDIEIAD